MDTWNLDMEIENKKYEPDNNMANSTEFLCDRKLQDLNGNIKCESTDKLLLYNPYLKKLRISPAMNIKDVQWENPIQSFISKEGLHHMATCQTVMFRGVLKLLSLVCVAGPGQGKSIGWILPILNNLIDENLYRNLPETIGPRVIVLCPGHLVCQNLTHAVQSLIQQIGLKLFVVAGNKSSKDSDLMETTAEIINGCDILVISPAKLKLLLSENKTDLSRCCHFIVESAHQTLFLHENSIVQVLAEWGKSRLQFTKNNLTPNQMIVVTEEWSKPVEDFVAKIMSIKWKPLLLFSSITEAAVYKKLCFSPSFFTNNFSTKISYLLKLIFNNRRKRIVVCISSEKVMKKANQELTSVGIHTHMLTSCMDTIDRDEHLQKCSTRDGVVLLVSDKTLTTLRNVPGCFQILVHFDFPELSKKSFGTRFFFLRDFLSKEKIKDDGDRVSSVELLIDSEDSQAFKSLYSLMSRAGTKIRINLKSNSFCKKVALMNNICDTTCVSRHYLQKSDQPSQQLSGEIKFEVLQVLSPVSYIIKIQDENLEELEQTRILRMAIHFSKPSQTKGISRRYLRVGLHVCVLTAISTYERAEIVNISLSEDEETVSIGVLYLDLGFEDKDILNDKIFQLPPCFDVEKFPARAVRAHVLGVAPNLQDPDWSSRCTQIVEAYLNPPAHLKFDREEVCRGLVLLRLRDVLFLDRCQKWVRHDNLGSWILHFETKSWLLNNSWGVKSSTFKDHILGLAKKSGLVVGESQEVTNVDTIDDPDDDHPSYLNSTQLMQSWITLNEFIIVIVTEVLSTEEFYVQISSQLGALMRLQQDLLKYRTQMINPENSWFPNIGDIVILRETVEDDFCRGQVKNVAQDNIQVFLVDSGRIVNTRLDDICLCPPDLISILPAQAIKCKLSGIRVNSDKVVEAGDLLYTLSSHTEAEHVPVDMVCVPVSRDADLYHVKLYNTSAGQESNLADSLVRKNLAIYNEKKSDNFDEILPSGWDDELEEIPWTFDKNLLRREVEEETDLSEDDTLSPIHHGLPDSSSKNSGIITEPKRYCAVRWSQTPDFVLIWVDVPCYYELVKERVIFEISSESLNFKAGETIDDINIEYTLPSKELKLFGKVDPDSSSFDVKPQHVQIKCFKSVKEIWNQLTMEKWDWIRRFDVIEEGEIDQIDCEFAEGGQKQYDIQPQPEAVFELDEDCSDNDNEEFSDNEASDTENDFVEDSEEESLNAEDYQKEENV